MSATPDSTLADPRGHRRSARLLAQRTAERDEALARESATGEVLQVINSSPGDLTPVFEATLERQCAFAGLISAFCCLSEGESAAACCGPGVHRS